MTIEEKSLELKQFVSQYDTKLFLGSLSALIKFINSDKTLDELKGLSSPQRQLNYLAGLHLTSEREVAKELKYQYSREEWIHIKNLLIEIETSYHAMFYPADENEVDELWIKQRSVAMPSFLSFFNQGDLNYEEQVVERIREYFEKFDADILKHFGLSINDFIGIYDFLDELLHRKLNDFIVPKEGEVSWEEFATDMIAKNINPPEWNDHLPQHFKDLFENIYDSGRIQRFSTDELADAFGEKKCRAYINALTAQRASTNFTFYSEKNIIYSKPIFEVGDNQYQFIDLKQIIQAIYNLLFDFCKVLPGGADRLYKIRGEKLEEKIVRMFETFFGDQAKIFTSYYTEDGHEQDILILYRGVALIIEAKASKRDEPLRDPARAYPLIKSNFDEVIQKGYDQAYRVKSKFIDKEVLRIFSDQTLRNHVIDIPTRKYHKVYSIIITLDRFGQIQTDLSRLLTVNDNDSYPLSICVDDLEVFLLYLMKFGSKVAHLINYLDIREYLHGGLICGDELEIAGAILAGKINFKNAMSDDTIVTSPDLATIFDQMYETGLGFIKEKNIERKKSGKYLVYGK